MKYTYSCLKMLTDTSLFISVLAASVSLFFPCSNLFILPYILAFICLLTSILVERMHFFRFFACAASFSSLLLVHSLADIFLVASVLIYFNICILKLYIYPKYSVFQSISAKYNGIGLCCALLGIVKGNQWIFAMSCTAIITSIFLLRLLRHQESTINMRPYAASELCFLLLFLILSCVFSSNTFFSLAVAVLKGFYNIIILPILLLAAFLIFGLFSAILWVISLLPTHNDTLQQEAQELILESEELIAESESVNTSPVLYWSFRVLFAFIILFILFLIIRKLVRTMSNQYSGIKSNAKIDYGSAVGAHTRNSPFTFNRTPAGRIRRSYASYHHTLKKYGYYIHVGTTSEDIAGMSPPLYEKESWELRTLYIQARYKTNPDLTAQDAKRAAELSSDLCKFIKTSQKI